MFLFIEAIFKRFCGQNATGVMDSIFVINKSHMQVVSL